MIPVRTHRPTDIMWLWEAPMQVEDRERQLWQMIKGNDVTSAGWSAQLQVIYTVYHQTLYSLT